MKKIFTLVTLIISFSVVHAQKSLVNFWNFNLAPADTAGAAYLKPTVALNSNASIVYAGAFTDLVLNTDASKNPVEDLTNELIKTTDPTIDYSLRVRSPYGPLIISLPTNGYNNVVVKYGIWRSGSGSTTNTVKYTVDGINWVSDGLVISVNGTINNGNTYPVNVSALPLDLITLDFSNISGVNDNPNFKVQIMYDIAAGGNNRYDNISLQADPIGVPVLVSNFSAAVNNNIASISWTTTNASNIAKYVVEKSLDNVNFKAVQTVAAKNTIAATDYTVTDFAGVAQAYRLKIVSTDGSISYSNIVVINSVANSTLQVYPNPATTDNVTITHPAAGYNAIIKIENINGKLVSAAKAAKSSTQTSINISNLSKGTYLVSFEDNGKKQLTKLVK
jgi:hypothetical protein